MLGYTLPAVEFGSMSDIFDDLNVEAVRLSFCVWENQFRGNRISVGPPPLQLLDHRPGAEVPLVLHSS